jgi:hypothetical protein|tara:strand:+ start:327 stop:539 length:213 start_codon:yes stop_codon:yes gene_type:complete
MPINKIYDNYPKMRSKINDEFIECAYCHVSEILINNQLENHAIKCPYRKDQENFIQSNKEHQNFHDWSED